MAKYSVIASGSHQPSQGYLDSLTSYLPSVQDLTEYMPDGLKQCAPFCSEGGQLDHEGKDVVLCASMEGYRTSEDPSKTFLMLGYTNGLQVYDVTPSSSMMIELICHRGEAVKCAKLLPHPSLSSTHQIEDEESTSGEILDDLHPLVAIASTQDSSCASTVQLLSLRSKVVAKTLEFNAPVRGLDVSASVLVVVLQDHTLHVFGARSLRKRFQLTSYPNPTKHVVMAVGSSWLAYPYAGADAELQWHGKHQGLPISTTLCEMASLGAVRPASSSSGSTAGGANFSYSSVTEAAQGIASLTATGASILGKAIHETYSAYNEGNLSGNGDMAASGLTHSTQKMYGNGHAHGETGAGANGTGTSAAGTSIDRKTKKHEGTVMVIDVRNRSVVTHFDATHSGALRGAIPVVVAAAEAAGGVAGGGVGMAALHSMSFSPSGMLLATCTASGQNVLVYRLDPAARTAQNTMGTTSDGGAEGTAAAALLAAPTVKVELGFKLVRGITHATIIHLRFSEDSCWVAASTSRGTTHLYVIDPHGRSPANAHARVQVQVEGGSNSGVEIQEAGLLDASGSLALSSSMQGLDSQGGGGGATSSVHVAGTGVVPPQPEALYMMPHRKEQQRIAEEEKGGTAHLLVGSSARLRQPWPPLEPKSDESFERLGLQDGWGEISDGVLSPTCTDIKGVGSGFGGDADDDLVEVRVPEAAPATTTSGNPFVVAVDPAASSAQRTKPSRSASPAYPGQMENVKHAVKGAVVTASDAVGDLVTGAAWRTPFVSTSTFFGAERRLFVAAEPGVMSCYALHAVSKQDGIVSPSSSPPLISVNGATAHAKDVYVLSAVRHWDMRRAAVEAAEAESSDATATGNIDSSPSNLFASGGGVPPPLPPVHGGGKKKKKKPKGGGALQGWDLATREEAAQPPSRVAPAVSQVVQRQDVEQQRQGGAPESTVHEWLAQAEIRTHSAPLVPLWADPQISIHVLRSPSSTRGDAADVDIDIVSATPAVEEVSESIVQDQAGPTRGGSSSSKKKKKKKTKGGGSGGDAAAPSANPTTTSDTQMLAKAQAGAQAKQQQQQQQHQQQQQQQQQQSGSVGGFELFIERRHYAPLAIRRAGPVPMQSCAFADSDSGGAGAGDLQPSHLGANSEGNSGQVLGQGASPVFDGKWRQPADPVIPALELSGNISAAMSSALEPAPDRDKDYGYGAMNVSNGVEDGTCGDIGQSIFGPSGLLQDSYFGGKK
jgi:hypothetical protein